MGTIVEGLSDLKAQLRRIRQEVTKEWPVTVVVGFSQYYALIVHEDLEAYHRVGQAKYLESAFYDLKQEIKDLVRRSIKMGMSPEKAFLRAGLMLQREAQQRTPVDTGALKASAYTALEQNMEEAAARAKAVSDGILERAA